MKIAKRIIIAFIIFIQFGLWAQHPRKDWYTLYSAKDTAMGIDLVNALNTNPKPAGAKPVIVAVIDGGTDINHEDLKANIWVNLKEIPGNGVDDDHNGYIDDMNGWDFIGGSEKDVIYDNLELTRLLRMYKARFGAKSSKEIAKEDKADYKKFKELEAVHAKKLAEDTRIFQSFQFYKKITGAVISEIGSNDFSLKELEEYSPDKNEAKIGKTFILQNCEAGKTTPGEFLKDIKEGYDQLNASVNYQLDLNFDPRDIVGDNYLNADEKSYGNNEVKGPDALHGTHVAGIIGADRNNGIGVNGIAPLVQIMVIRVVPNGDERDKDVANAIRYAVDNGARVINMSFGKAYSFNKKVVDDAVKYAESKDVLLIHAAGNDAKNTDEESNFPSPRYENGTYCTTWIEVGASSMNQSPSGFSNYGKKTVNVFAPGSEIYSTIEDNRYEWEEGTSMASPVVAGVAALIRSYYPNLTAMQVKSVIESSVVKPEAKFKKPGAKRKRTKYKKLCTSQGIVNANNALKAAATIK
jgi:subtilisin family serine protease